MLNELMPGDRVLVFDSRLYKDDVSTPLTTTMKPCKIVNRYGSWSKWDDGYHDGFVWVPNIKRILYSDLIDVEFDYRPGEISKGHFTPSFKNKL